MENFTEDEQNFINFCFETTLTHYAKTPKDKTKKKDLLEVIDYRDRYVGTLGVKRHRIKESIYHKLGYCKDGRTTLAQRALEKEEFEKNEKITNELKTKAAVEEIDQKMEELQEIKDRLLGHDENFKIFADKRAKEVNDIFQKDMSSTKSNQQSLILSELDLKLKSMNMTQLKQLAENKGLKIKSKIKKADLIQTIKDGDENGSN